jgi:TonB family protein
MRTIENLGAWWLQIAALVAAAALAMLLLRAAAPHARLLCWQCVLAACLALPMVQPWRSAQDAAIGVTLHAAAPRFAGSTRPAWNWPEAILDVIGIGVAARLAMLAAGLWRLRRYRKNSRTAGQSWGELQARLGVHAEIRISDEVAGPVTFGLRRPLVLLPERWVANEAVVCHELLHVRRRDWAFAVSEEMIRAVLWFHPAVWRLISQIRLAREQTVDRAVVDVTKSREQYLRTLLAIAEAKAHLDLAPAPLFLRTRHVPKRVAALMREVSMSRQRFICSVLLFAAAGLTAMLVSSRAFPLQAAPQSLELKKGTYKSFAKGFYPAEAKDKRIEGDVTVRYTLDAEGRVAEATVVSGPQELRAAALQFMRSLKIEKGSPLSLLQNGAGEFTISYRLGDQPLEVAPESQEKRAVYKRPPVYPPTAKQAGIEGMVTLDVLVGKDGTVREIEVISGEPLLADAAKEAVSNWLFRPTLLNGEPVEVKTQVDINFSLTK